MTSNTSPCGTNPCASPVAERPRYFPRQIITPDDLTLEQEYFRNKLRRHNRLVHGWGVVCGAKVCPAPQTNTSSGTLSYQPWMVTVTSGYILGPYGDEILIDCCRGIDVRTTGTSGVTGDPCVQPVDPWCSDVYVQRDFTQPLYVAVKYQECRTRPVRVQPVGCGCNDNTCEYSRMQDGYEIGILAACPDAGTTPPDRNTLLQGATPDCPVCSSQPWVVLASVTVDSDGNVSIDNCGCRRIVASWGGFWSNCTTMSAAPTIDALSGVDLQNLTQGATAISATVNFDPALQQAGQVTADLGPGIAITSFTQSGATAGVWTLNFNVATNAAAGPRDLTVSSKTGSSTLEDAIKIVSAAAVKSSAAPAQPAAAKVMAPADATATSDAKSADPGDGGAATPSTRKKKG